jgi:hypothetical protein
MGDGSGAWHRLGAILVGTGLICRDDLTVALEEQSRGGHRERLGEILIRHGRLGHTSLAWALTEQSFLAQAAGAAG